MIQLVTPDRYVEFHDQLTEMHRLRCRVFKQRLGWDVAVTDDSEVDAFDALHPAYLLHAGATGAIQGCVRLLPTTGPTMLRDRFPALLDGQEAPCDPAIWESSRFAVDSRSSALKSAIGLAWATHELFAGMIEFGLWHRITTIVTATDARMERLLRRAGWPLKRIGAPRTFGTTLAVAGYLEVSCEALSRVRSLGPLSTSVLAVPVSA